MFLASLGVAALATINAVRFPSRQVRVKPAKIDLDGVLPSQHLSQAIQIRTVSHADPSRIDPAEFLRFHKLLESSYPLVHAKLSREVVAGYSLLYTWKGATDQKIPILLMGHMDVVPVQPGTESSWSHSPYTGEIAQGFVWGRGAMDNKVGVIGILEAVEKLLAEGYEPHRTVYLAFGHDEELGGSVGASNIAELLRTRGVRLEFVLDEGLMVTDGLMPGVKPPVAMMGIAEKGYVSVLLTAEAEGGHSSMPPNHTAAGILSQAIVDLENNPMPARLNGAAKLLFDFVGPEMDFKKRLVFANARFLQPLLTRKLSAMPPTNALIRTTTAATMLEGSIKDNILPVKARGVVNFRILPGDRIEDVLEHVRATARDPHIVVSLAAGAQTEPSRLSRADSVAFRTLQKTIHQIFPGVLTAPSLFIAATDSRHYESISDNVYRFLPLTLRPADLKRFHGTDERIGVEDFTQCVRFYYQLIRNADE